MLRATRREITQPTGNTITVDGEEYGELVVTGYDYDVCGYTVCLPYDLTLTAAGAKVYAPSTIETVKGVTTVTFAEVEDKAMNAYIPYLITVEGEEEVSLGTAATVVSISKTPAEPQSYGAFAFKGTTVTIGNDELYDADAPAYILQSDGNWHRVPQNQPKAYVGAFRSYFQSATANAARLLATAFSSSADTQGITVLRTTDADGTQHYYDLSGRRLSGKPQQGMYIYNGKKYMNK